MGFNWNGSAVTYKPAPNPVGNKPLISGGKSLSAYDTSRDCTRIRIPKGSLLNEAPSYPYAWEGCVFL